MLLSKRSYHEPEEGLHSDKRNASSGTYRESSQHSEELSSTVTCRAAGATLNPKSPKWEAKNPITQTTLLLQFFEQVGMLLLSLLVNLWSLYHGADL